MRLKPDRTFTQGKVPTNKSGRYNTKEVVDSVPELRWPNESYYRVQGNRKFVVLHRVQQPGSYCDG